MCKYRLFLTGSLFNLVHKKFFFLSSVYGMDDRKTGEILHGRRRRTFCLCLVRSDYNLDLRRQPGLHAVFVLVIVKVTLLSP